jgi:hypothetical protein
LGLLGRELLGIRHSFRLHRKAGVLPGIPAAYEGARLGPTRLPELLRHTGASGLLRSGTIGNDPGITGQVKRAGAFAHVVRRQSHGPTRLGRTRIVRPIGANVDDYQRCTGVPEMAQLCDREAVGIGMGAFIVALRRARIGCVRRGSAGIP